MFKRILRRVLRGTLIILGVLWVGLQVATTVAYLPTIRFLSNLFQFDPRLLLSEEESNFSIPVLAVFFDSPFFYLFTITALVFSVTGTLVLARKRSIYVALGLFVAFILPRERINWGVVRDRSSKRAIPFATVRLYQVIGEDTKLIREEVSDTDGRYRLHLGNLAVNHKLRVSATGYEVVELDLDYRNSGLRFVDLNFEVFLSKHEVAEAKLLSQLKYTQSRLYKYLMGIIYLSSVVYLVFFVYYNLAYPGSTYGWVNLALFVFSVGRNTLIVRERSRNNVGRVLDIETGLPLAGVRLRVVDKSGKQEVQMTDKLGIVRFSMPLGNYPLSLYSEDFVLVDNHTGEAKPDQAVTINDHGFMMYDLYMRIKSDSENSQPKRNELFNPFK